VPAVPQKLRLSLIVCIEYSPGKLRNELYGVAIGDDMRGRLGDMRCGIRCDPDKGKGAVRYAD
jgi:hypothetical protein